MNRPDAITQEDQPCWVLRLPDGDEVDGGIWEDPHYNTEQAAAETASDEADDHDPPRVLVPVQLDDRCWIATAVCGKQYDGDGTFSAEHWPNPGDLLEALLAADWRPVEGGGMACDDDGCETCAYLPTVPAPTQIPGQMSLT